MATFAELVADVKVITNRPDLDADIKLAVRAATLKAHQTDFYPKDIFETAIQWSPTAYVQSLDFRSLIPRWRAFKYLRKYDATVSPGAPGIFFDFILPEKVIDLYKTDRMNVCYAAGAEIQIKSNTLDDYMLLGCYLYPDTNEVTYDSWIALDNPQAIEYEAASKIFKSIGYDEQAAEFRQEVAVQYALLQSNNLLGQGY